MSGKEGRRGREGLLKWDHRQGNLSLWREEKEIVVLDGKDHGDKLWTFGPDPMTGRVLV